MATMDVAQVAEKGQTPRERLARKWRPVRCQQWQHQGMPGTCRSRIVGLG